MNKQSNYIDIKDCEAIEIREELGKEEFDRLKNNVLKSIKMEEKTNKVQAININKKLWKGLAIAIALIVLIPSGAIAVSKFNSKFFGDSDNAPIEDYVTEVNESGDFSCYGTDWRLTVNKVLYSDATNSGIIQFEIENRSKNGEKFYDKLVEPLEEKYDIKGIEEICNTNFGIDVIGFMSKSGKLGCVDSKIFLDEANSDKDISKCQIVFNTFEDIDFNNTNIKIQVNEIQNSNPIMRIDIPKKEPIPNYTWANSNGDIEFVFTSIDYLVKIPKEEWIVETGETKINDISVQFDDGTQYVILSDRNYIYNEFYATSGDAGTWGAFTKIIDLSKVVSVTVNGKVYYTKNAK